MTVSKTYYMGFDAGTQSVKVAVYDDQFHPITTHSLATTVRNPQAGWVEMDVDEYLENTISCIKACVADLKAQGIDPKQIRAIMGDGVICGIVGVDEDGQAITPYINYLDSRTQEDVAEINALNLDIWAKETGNPQALCMFPAMFARWLLKNHSDFASRGAKFVHNAPYILMHLAGLKAKDAFIDWGAMSGWGLGYKVEEKVWSEEQLAILGIDPKLMPRILRPWDVVGTLTPALAECTGLSADTVICAGAGDTMQSMLGCGVFDAGRGVDVAGTCAMFCVSTTGIIPELSRKETGLIFNSGSLPNTYFYWGFIRTGGLALRWFKDAICQKSNESDYYKTLTEGAAKVNPGSNGVLFLPYLSAGQGQAKGAFLNLTLNDDQFVQWRAVLESIGYDYMEIVETYRNAGVNLDTITVTEGGSRDNLWNQIKSDMLNANVVRYQHAGGAVTTNCIFAAYAVGALEDIVKVLDSQLKADCTYSPKSENTALYQALLVEKQRLVKTELTAGFATLDKIRQITENASVKH